MVASSPWVVLLLPVAAVSCAAPTRGPSGPVAAAPDLTCSVWDREESFSRSVREHDARAFAEHVQEGALFLEGEGGVLRGRAAIVKGWEAILRGEALQLEWHPTSVLVTGDPHVALSRGRAWATVTRPGGPPKLVAGVFQSVWVLDPDGVWRVVLDGGPPPPREVTPAELQQIRESIPRACPGADPHRP